MKNYLQIYTYSNSIQTDYNVSPKSFDKWSRIISLSWKINNKTYNEIIRPIGFQIGNDTEEFTSITNDHAVLYGIDILKALNSFLDILKYVDYIVGHNVDYHLNLIKSELYRYKLIEEFPEIPTICLMKYGAKLITDTQRYPSLNKLYHFIYNEEIDKTNYLNKPKNKLIHYIFSIDRCFHYMLEKNIFSDININPIKSFFIIPKENNVFDFKISHIDNIIYYENSVLFKNVINYQEYKHLGFSIITLNENDKKEFLLIDYRGVLILNIDEEINFVFDWGCEYYVIKVNEDICYFISKRENFTILHRYEDFDVVNNYLIVSNYFNNNSLIKSNGEVLFNNKKILIRKDSDFFAVIDNEVYTIYDMNLKPKITLKNNDYNVIEIEKNYLKYTIHENLMGIIKLDSELSFMNLEKKKIIIPKFKYIEILSTELIIYSNHYIIIEKYKNFEVGNYGVADYNGNILINDEYDHIKIVKNKIICTKNNTEIIFLINDLKP